MTEPHAAQDRWETANLHVYWQGEERTFPVPFRPEEATLLDLLPAARELTGQATAAAIEGARAAGREVSCRAGCGACCRQLVAISVVEAGALAEVVASMPPERQAIIRARFADAARRLEAAGLLDPNAPRGDRTVQARDLGSRDLTLRELGQRYFALEIACPLLEDESCGIHPERPLVCREHHVTTPAENCARLYQVSVDRLEPPVRVGEALTRAADRVAGVGPWMIPLVLSLEWAEAHLAELRRPHDGLPLLRTLMAEIDRDCERPFDRRES
ncbi:MAG TPA: YkgJ family cysteine cluster protein [Gemmataceae bacterium]|nr:YkgJ family cysteine cluster protein [Gemmataceae bacterium]